MLDRVYIYNALAALHRWCRGEGTRREYASALAQVPTPGEVLSDPIERRARALLALVPPDRRAVPGSCFADLQGAVLQGANFEGTDF